MRDYGDLLLKKANLIEERGGISSFQSSEFDIGKGSHQVE